MHARDVKGGTSCWFACLTHTVDGARALEGRSRTESFVCRSQRGNRDRQADEQTKLFGFFFFSKCKSGPWCRLSFGRSCGRRERKNACTGVDPQPASLCHTVGHPGQKRSRTGGRLAVASQSTGGWRRLWSSVECELEEKGRHEGRRQRASMNMEAYPGEGR